MMFALGPLLHNTAAMAGAVSGGFTPASVSGLDLWIEADPTLLYTDAGSTLATTDGQAVFQANDKSTSSRNLSQTTLGNRPLYKTDLAKPSLLFTAASGQHLDSATSTAWVDGSGQCWFAMSVRVAATASIQEIIHIHGATGYVCDVYVQTQAHMEYQNVAAGFFEDASAAATITAGTDLVIIATLATTGAEAFVDNVSNGSTAITGTLKTDSNQAIIGSNNGGSNPFGGRLYGLCTGTGTLSSGDRASLQTYLAALHP